MKDKELNAHVRKGIYMKGRANLEFTTPTPYEAVSGSNQVPPCPIDLKAWTENSINYIV